MAIQVSRFHDGGFVLHKIPREGMEGSRERLQYSAWYDAAGKLLDAELFLANDTTRPVSGRSKNVREYLGRVGNRHVLR